jgi:superfamily II DNA helicase RecQ
MLVERSVPVNDWLKCTTMGIVARPQKTVVFAEFPKLDSKIRVLITTVAFGMGVNIPDISYVLHWGVPITVVAYWQEVGRCA